MHDHSSPQRMEFSVDNAMLQMKLNKTINDSSKETDGDKNRKWSWPQCYLLKSRIYDHTAYRTVKVSAYDYQTPVEKKSNCVSLGFHGANILPVLWWLIYLPSWY